MKGGIWTVLFYCANAFNSNKSKVIRACILPAPLPFCFRPRCVAKRGEKIAQRLQYLTKQSYRRSHNSESAEPNTVMDGDSILAQIL